MSTTIEEEVLEELAMAMKNWPPFNSNHEGFAILKEEVDELWEEVKFGTVSRMREEAIQVAAMAIRFVHDLDKRESKGHPVS